MHGQPLRDATAAGEWCSCDVGAAALGQLGPVIARVFHCSRASSAETILARSVREAAEPVPRHHPAGIVGQRRAPARHGSKPRAARWACPRIRPCSPRPPRGSSSARSRRGDAEAEPEIGVLRCRAARRPRGAGFPDSPGVGTRPSRTAPRGGRGRARCTHAGACSQTSRPTHRNASGLVCAARQGRRDALDHRPGCARTRSSTGPTCSSVWTTISLASRTPRLGKRADPAALATTAGVEVDHVRAREHHSPAGETGVDCQAQSTPGTAMRPRWRWAHATAPPRSSAPRRFCRRSA